MHRAINVQHRSDSVFHCTTEEDFEALDVLDYQPTQNLMFCSVSVSMPRMVEFILDNLRHWTEAQLPPVLLYFGILRGVVIRPRRARRLGMVRMSVLLDGKIRVGHVRFSSPLSGVFVSYSYWKWVLDRCFE